MPAKDRSRVCDSCAKAVHDTSNMSDEELSALLARNPDACLKVTPGYGNCTILPVAGQTSRVESA